MKATIARVALVMAAVAGVLPVAASPASASSDQIYGGCFFDTDAPPTASGTNTGVIGDISVTNRGVDIRIGAVVSCKIQVNGVDAPGTTFSYSGYGAQAGANPISFTATEFDSVAECQRVVYQDGVDTGWICAEEVVLQVPPEVMPIQLVLEILNDVLVYSVDPQVCPVLAAHPGTYGVLTVAPDGDVDAPDPLDLWDGPLYDCPPYGNF
jgi:hypothetical protein